MTGVGGSATIRPLRMPSSVETTASHDEGIRLREYLGVLRRRKWSLILVTLFAIGGAALYTELATPIYRSASSVQATTTVLLPGTTTGAGLSMQTEQQAVTSEPVSKCAALLLEDKTFEADPTEATLDTSAICTTEALSAAEIPAGLDSHVSVVVPPQTNVLQISFDDPSSRVSQAAAQAFALAYIHSKVVRAEQLLGQLRAPLLKTQESLTKQVTKLNSRLDQAIQDNSAGHVTTAGSEKVQNLTSQRNAAQQKLDNITLQLLNLDPSHINPPQLLLPAKLPHKPISPNKVLAGALGLFAGLALGIVLAFLRERLDDTIRGRTDLEESSGAPILAVIPKLHHWRRTQDARLITREDPKGLPSEAYRKLRTSVLFSAAQRQLKVVMICSAMAGDGKTTTAANLAVLLAETDKRVILLSADLRRPRLHRFFDVETKVGLSTVLSGKASAAQVTLDPGIANLRIVPSGPVPERPAELLQSSRMRDVVTQLSDVSDFLLIDTAPLLLVSETLSLAPLVDGVLLVADAEKTSRGAVRRARDDLDDVAAPVIGSILNKYDPSKAHDYHSYGYYYGAYGYGPRRKEGAFDLGSRSE